MSSNSHGAWFIADSPNFQVCSLRSAAQAELVAHHCEALRQDHVALWDCKATWNPRCQIILHADRENYLRAVGEGGGNTLASALVKSTAGRIATRRIDLRCDIQDYLTAALPHEMCHIVLADRIPKAPLWFDEGIAILADPIAKQRLHERDLQVGLQRGEAFALAELLTMERYPSADRWGVFYGQSASLVRRLLRQGSPEKLLEFVKLNREIGANLALRETYGIASVQKIERLWRSEAPLGIVNTEDFRPLVRAPELLAVTGRP